MCDFLGGCSTKCGRRRLHSLDNGIRLTPNLTRMLPIIQTFGSGHSHYDSTRPLNLQCYTPMDSDLKFLTLPTQMLISRSTHKKQLLVVAVARTHTRAETAYLAPATSPTRVVSAASSPADRRSPSYIRYVGDQCESELSWSVPAALARSRLRGLGSSASASSMCLSLARCLEVEG